MENQKMDSKNGTNTVIVAIRNNMAKVFTNTETIKKTYVKNVDLFLNIPVNWMSIILTVIIITTIPQIYRHYVQIVID